MPDTDWNRGQLLGELLIAVGAMAIVSGRIPRDRLLAAGIWSQGIAMVLVAGSVYYPRTEFEVAALAIVSLSCCWAPWIIPARKASPAPAVEVEPGTPRSEEVPIHNLPDIVAPDVTGQA